MTRNFPADPFNPHGKRIPAAADPFQMPPSQVLYEVGADLFAPHFTRREFESRYADLLAVALAAIRQAPDAQISPAALRAVLEDGSNRPRGVKLDAQGRRAVIGHGMFGAFLARTLAKRDLSIDRTPGRVRVRCWAGAVERNSGASFAHAWGCIAVAALDLIDAADDGKSAARARKAIAGAVATLERAGFPRDEIVHSARRMLAPDVLAIAAPIMGNKLVPGLGAAPIDSAIMAAVMAAREEGVLRSHLERDLGKTHGKRPVSAAIEGQLARGELQEARRQPLGGGRPGMRLFAG